MPVSSKQRPPLSYIAKPRLSGMRALHPKLGSLSARQSTPPDPGRRIKTRKMSGTSRYDSLKKGALPDYTDFAYKEAVSRLRSMMTDSYVPPHHKYSSHYASGRGDDSDEESGVSVTVSDTTRVAQLGTFRKPKLSSLPKLSQVLHEVPHPSNTGVGAPPELMGFIERQEEYIEQLEKESQYCRDELSQLVGKVKDLIAENEALHAQQKPGSINISTPEVHSEARKFDVHTECKLKHHLEGPNIVFESRISELEAQLAQSRHEMKKAQEETSNLKRKMLENDPTSTSSDFYRQIEQLHREKKELSDALNRLQSATAQMRERESDASRKVLRTQDVAEKAQMDRQQAELEVQRLKTELEMQHERLLDLLSDQTRKVGEERSHSERRYLQHVEQLNAELAMQRDAATKLQLDVERHQRMEEDLRRDLSAKTATIDTVRKELSAKIANMQIELSKVLTERDSFEQELNSSRMSGERTELASKQEYSRLQVEVNALRQRITKTDNELMQARRDNMRLSEQIASQEKEITLYKIQIGEMELNDDGTPKKSDSVRELEGLVEKQSQAMNAITQQCQSLAQRLEDATLHHQQEMAELQTNLEFLTGRLELSISARQWQEGAVNENIEEHYSQPTEYDNQQIEELATHHETSPYQVEERQHSPSGSTAYQPQLHPLPETTLEDVSNIPVRPDSRSGMAEKPILSRSSSRGDRSESPLLRKESRKSPLQRRESRQRMHQKTPPPEYVSPVRQEVDYSPSSSYPETHYPTEEEPSYHTDGQNQYQQEYTSNEAYQQPYHSQETRKSPLQRRESRLQMHQRTPPSGYISPSRQETEYPTNPNYSDTSTADQRYNTGRDQYQLEQTPQYDAEQYRGNVQQSEGYGRGELYAQERPEQYKQDTELRNRTPSRESLRSSHPQGYSQGPDLRQGSPQDYQISENPQQGYPSHEQVSQRVSPSNESLGPQSKFQPQQKTPYQVSDQQLRQGSPQNYQPSETKQQGYSSQQEQVSQRVTASNESLGAQNIYQQENYDQKAQYQQESSDQGRRPLSSDYEDGVQPQIKQASPAYESQQSELKATDNAKTRQGPTLRKEPSSVSMRPQQKIQSKNLPTKFQS